MENNGSNSVSGGAHGDNRPSFEQNFLRLQDVVAKLSEGNLTSQEALSAYEEGMSLADLCARMLDEAELRVQQVSERALRSGSSSLTDLDTELRAHSGDGGQGLVAIEIESHEATLFFDAADAEPERVPVRTSDPKGRTSRPSPASPDDLDPLFDEED